ncbi:MAG TPA: efflux transporter outer membrane subunit, partial [Gammaproteobacteria bacterium]|nr:efflux transporter outer membrane subunit [Gammaproteobacteria bacterium]
AIPVQLPSALLERRPDVAKAERLAAQANAQIGVAISAFFPTLTLSATGGYSSNTFSKLFTQPARFWSLGPALAETIFDGGARSAVVAAARANYDVTVASYRQVVLSAFQDVEDNLVSLRRLDAEAVVQKEAVLSAEKALQFTMNEYKAGTVAYSQVITAQTTLFAAKQTAITINGRRMVAAVGLIKALGGGWKTSERRKDVC